jgi:hypothetical protein
MDLTKEECKNKIANNNNFDSFKRAIRHTFNRELLQSEEEFINKIIDESIQLYADQEAKAYANWLSNQVIAGRTMTKLWNDYREQVS